MPSRCVHALLICSLLVVARQATAVDTHMDHDFEGSWQPVTSPAEATSRVSGQIPEHWRENSVWTGSEVEVAYQRLTTGVFAGEASWRIQVDAVRAGRAQIGLSDIPLDGERFIRLRFAGRSSAASTLSAAINMSHSPWQTHWSRQIALTAEWQQYEFIVPPLAADPKARFQFVISQPGIFDLDNVEISYLSADELNDGRDFSGNLLSTSTFVAGVAGGWVSQPSDRPDDLYQVDRNHIGPSGLPSLRLHDDGREGERPMTQVTCAFYGRGGSVHTLSVWAKGSANGQVAHLRCGPASEALYTGDWQHNLSLTTEWQRYSFQVTLPHTPDGFHLFRITSHDGRPYWIDACQAEVGDSATAWQRSGPAQVEVVATAVANAGLSFTDQDLTARYLVHGTLPAGAVLRAHVVDIRGHQHQLADRVLPAISSTQPHRGNLVAETTSLAAYGTYRLHLQIIDADQRPLSRPAELSLCRVREPRRRDELAEDSPFGIHTRYGDRDLQLARDLGFTWVRTLYHTNWLTAQPEPTTWTWDTLDRRIGNLRKHRFMILGVIAGVPSWARREIPGLRGWKAMNAAVANLDAWQEFSQRIARRYRREIQHWELWNEPYWPHFLIGGLDDNGTAVHASAADFAEMFRRAHAGVRAGNRRAKTVWNLGPHEDRAWHQQVVGEGLHRLADITAYHIYTSSGLGVAGDIIEHQVSLIQADGGAAARRQETWCSEGGSAGALTSNAIDWAPGDQRAADHTKADHIVRFYCSVLANGSTRFFLYAHYGYGQWRRNYDNLHQDGTPSAISVAVSNLAWHIDGRPFQQRVDCGNGLTAYCFGDRRDERAVVLIPNSSTVPNLATIPDGWHVSDLYGNPQNDLTFSGESLLILGPSARDIATAYGVSLP